MGGGGAPRKERRRGRKRWVYLVRVPIEPGLYTRAWLTWDRLSASNVSCLLSCICPACLRRDVVWVLVRI
jgi:hypothetical protein